MSDIDELPPPSSEPAVPPSGGEEQTVSPHSLLDDYMSNPTTTSTAPGEEEDEEEEIPPPPYSQDDVMDPPPSQPAVTGGLIDLDLDPLSPTQPDHSMASPPAPIDLLDPIPVNNSSTGADGQGSPISPMDFDLIPPSNSCGADGSTSPQGQGDHIGLDLDPIPITNSIGTDAMSPNECKVDLHPIPPGNDMGGTVDLSPLNDPIEPDLIQAAAASEAEQPQTADQMDIDPPPLTQNDQSGGKASSPGYDANFDPIPVTHLTNTGASTTGNDHIESDPIPATNTDRHITTPPAEEKKPIQHTPTEEKNPIQHTPTEENNLYEPVEFVKPKDHHLIQKEPDSAYPIQHTPTEEKDHYADGFEAAIEKQVSYQTISKTQLIWILSNSWWTHVVEISANLWLPSRINLTWDFTREIVIYTQEAWYGLRHTCGHSLVMDR